MSPVVFCQANSASDQASIAKNSETWLVTTNRWGNLMYQTLTLSNHAGKLNGTLDGNLLVGQRSNSSIEFIVTDQNNATYSYKGDIKTNSIVGNVDMPDTNDQNVRVTHNFTARLIPNRPEGPPRRYVFEPTDYSNSFDPDRLPVLTVWPGDSIKTSTIDSGGVDEKGITRALFGNPQTGPFFIATAEPGDVLVIK
jgi:amidase